MKKETSVPHAQIDYQLLAHLSHDVRSPFNGLLGFSDLLSSHFDSLESDKQLEYAQLVHQLAHKSFFQLQFFLVWVKLISKNISLNHTSSTIDELVTQSTCCLESDFSSKTITTTVIGNKQTMLSCDTLLLSIALACVLNTAIKTLTSNADILLTILSTGEKIRLLISWEVSSLTETTTELVAQMPSFEEGYNNHTVHFWVAQQITQLHKGNLSLTSKGLETSTQFEVEFTLPVNG